MKFIPGRIMTGLFKNIPFQVLIMRKIMGHKNGCRLSAVIFKKIFHLIHHFNRSGIKWHTLMQLLGG